MNSSACAAMLPRGLRRRLRRPEMLPLRRRRPVLPLALLLSLQGRVPTRRQAWELRLASIYSEPSGKR